MTALSRLKQDFVRIKKDPVPYIVAEPLPSNILEWHYVVTGTTFWLGLSHTFFVQANECQPYLSQPNYLKKFDKCPGTSRACT